MIQPSSRYLLLAVLALSAACGGGQAAPVQPAGPAASSPEAPAASAAPSASVAPSASAAPAASAAPSATAAPGAPGPGDWDIWSHEQKMAYMKSTVMPKMGPMFHDLDPKKFSDPKCGLCHGAGAKDKTFKMPNPALPKLNLADMMKSDQQKNPKTFDFMVKQVKPQMAQLLGEPEYDPKSGKGFGCLECHTKK